MIVGRRTWKGQRGFGYPSPKNTAQATPKPYRVQFLGTAGPVSRRPVHLQENAHAPQSPSLAFPHRRSRLHSSPRAKLARGYHLPSRRRRRLGLRHRRAPNHRLFVTRATHTQAIDTEPARCSATSPARSARMASPSCPNSIAASSPTAAAPAPSSSSTSKPMPSSARSPPCPTPTASSTTPAEPGPRRLRRRQA